MSLLQKLLHHKYNTLRNQILIGFLFVMGIVLFIVGLLTYNLMSSLLTSNAERQIQQTAVQANGRLETLYKQVDTLATQVATNDYVQHLLLGEVKGESATFDQRQALMNVVDQIQVYSDGIHSFELYTPDGQRLFPLDEALLYTRVDTRWVKLAEQSKGRLVWIGLDPKDAEYVLAIRRVSLFDRWFSSGGYLLVRIQRSYFDFAELLDTNTGEEFMILVDQEQNLISSNYEGDIEKVINLESQIPPDLEKDFIVVKQQSDITHWKLILLVPVSSVTEGISILRTAIIFSGAIGFLLFLIISILLSTMITRPILNLIKTMRSSRLGSLKTNPEISSTIEINELNKTYNQMAQDMNRLIEIVYEKELVRSQAELKALQAQIDPHFLYNTLEALYWSLQEKDEDELAELVIAMSELFRYTISNSKSDEWVTIGDELEHAERYLQLMRMRFGERLHWEISVDAGCRAVAIPKLLIQPLVENAILHGVGNKRGPGFVFVTVQRDSAESKVVIRVTDDGPGMDVETVEWLNQTLRTGEQSASKGGIALANVNKRLRLYYGGALDDQLQIESKLGHGTSVIFAIPDSGGR